MQIVFLSLLLSVQTLISATPINYASQALFTQDLAKPTESIGMQEVYLQKRNWEESVSIGLNNAAKDALNNQNKIFEEHLQLTKLSAAKQAKAYETLPNDRTDLYMNYHRVPVNERVAFETKHNIPEAHINARNALDEHVAAVDLFRDTHVAAMADTDKLTNEAKLYDSKRPLPAVSPKFIDETVPLEVAPAMKPLTQPEATTDIVHVQVKSATPQNDNTLSTALIAGGAGLVVGGLIAESY